jgi:hypothetical protein
MLRGGRVCPQTVLFLSIHAFHNELESLMSKFPPVATQMRFLSVVGGKGTLCLLPYLSMCVVGRNRIEFLRFGIVIKVLINLARPFATLSKNVRCGDTWSRASFLCKFLRRSAMGELRVSTGHVSLVIPAAVPTS